MSVETIKRTSMPRMKPFMLREENDTETKSNAPETTNKKSMKKPVKKSEDDLKNDFQKVLETDAKEWVEKTFLKENAIPSNAYEIELVAVLEMLRSAYFLASDQPKYTIERVIQSHWKINIVDEPVKSMHKFFPSCKSTTLKKRYFAYASFGGLRLMLHAILAGFLHRLGQIGNLVYTDKKGETYSLAPEVFISLATDGIWTRDTLPMAISEDNMPIKIDTNPGKHLNVWIKGRGALALEIDLCDTDIILKEHASIPEGRLAATTYLQQTRSTAVRQNVTPILDNIIQNVVKTLREKNKKYKKKQRKKRKKRKKQHNRCPTPTSTVE